MKKEWIKIGMAVFLSLLLTLSMVSVVLAGPEGLPPGPDERLATPRLKGILTFSQDCTQGLTNINFIGNCKGQPVHILVPFFPMIQINNVNADTILNWRMDATGPEGCRSAGGGETLILTDVFSFTNTGNEIISRVELMYVVPKKTKK